MLEIYQLFHPNEAMAPQLWRNIFNTHMAVAKRVMVTEAPRATRLIAEARSIQDTHLKGTEFDADEAVSALEAQLPQ
jgi:hypothetical protein